MICVFVLKLKSVHNCFSIIPDKYMIEILRNMYEIIYLLIFDQSELDEEVLRFLFLCFLGLEEELELDELRLR